MRPPSPRCSPPAKSDVKALCLEMHDFWLAKALAGRPKDLAFCAALLDRGLVRRTVLKELYDMPALDIERKDVDAPGDGVDQGDVRMHSIRLSFLRGWSGWVRMPPLAAASVRPPTMFGDHLPMC